MALANIYSLDLIAWQTALFRARIWSANRKGFIISMEPWVADFAANDKVGWKSRAENGSVVIHSFKFNKLARPAFFYHYRSSNGI